MHDVVQDADVEEAEQLGVRVVPGELQVAVMGSDSGNEAEDPDEQEHYPAASPQIGSVNGFALTRRVVFALSGYS